VLGAIAAVHDYDWKEAEEQFKLARASEPVSPSVCNKYAGFYLTPLGRFEEALQESEKAIAQDPLNMAYRGWHLHILLSAEMYERTIVEAQNELEFDERHIAAHSQIALAHFFQGKLAEAREWAEEAFRRTGNALAVGLLAGLAKQGGEKERAEKLETTLRGMGPPEMITLGMTIYHVVCSEIDAAIDWYEDAIEQRQPFAAGWASAGFFRPLRASPRWPKLARIMNLPETG
jgi:tetratricopeptide (TPR) repeat protein